MIIDTGVSTIVSLLFYKGFGYYLWAGSFIISKEGPIMNNHSEFTLFF